MRNDPMLWMAAADYAVANGLTTREVEHRLVEGMLEGGYDEGWYVARPRVSLQFPDRDDIDRADLKLLAMPLGRYLTAARREFVIPLHRDDPDKDATLEALLDALQGDPVEPVPFRLDARDWCVDSSLLLELAQALIEFESLHDRRVFLPESEPQALCTTATQTVERQEHPADLQPERSRPDAESKGDGG